MDLFPTSLRQIDVYVDLKSNSIRRHIGTRIITPNEKNADVALVRVDPWIGFSQNVMPICLDGLYSEHLPRPHASTVHVDGIENHDACGTDGQLPKPYHVCKGPCHREVPTPSADDEECRHFLHGTLKDLVHVTVVILDDEVEGRTRTCYRTDPGEHGWCRVHHTDSKFTYTSTSDWGYCRESCASTNREGFVAVVRISILVVWASLIACNVL